MPSVSEAALMPVSLRSKKPLDEAVRCSLAVRRVDDPTGSAAKGKGRRIAPAAFAMTRCLVQKRNLTSA